MSDPVVPADLAPALSPWADPALIVGIALAVGIAVEFVVMARLRRWARGTEWKGDDLVVDAIRGLPVLWCLLLGVHAAIGEAPLGEAVRDYLQRGVLVAWILSATLVLSRMLVGLWRLGDGAATGGTGITLVPVVIRVAVGTVGAMVALQTVGVSVTPVLTALGVGGLAVALALQDTLSNLFAGIHVVASKKVRLGDMIRLDSGEEGVVTDITWRNTTIRTPADNLVVLPNTKLSQAVMTNYSMPQEDLVMSLAVGVGYGSDLDRVEASALAAAGEVQARLPAACADRPPVVRFAAFADSSIECRVVLWARNFAAQPLIRHELVKAIHRRFAADGIEIPFPIRTIIAK